MNDFRGSLRIEKAAMKLVLMLLMQLFLVTSANAQSARFLLTFDDGPSTKKNNNPTVSILNSLASNKIQNNIKAIFFTQTKLNSSDKGKTTKRLLNRQHHEGHLLAIHSGVLKRHSRHTNLSDSEMGLFLSTSKAVLKDITGIEPTIVRPTFWAFDARTLEFYQQAGLSMLLTDINVYDGKSWGYRANPRRKKVLHKQMRLVKKRIDNKQIKAVDEWIPIVVTFHDTNTWTADHMEEYLNLLVDSAVKVGIDLSPKKFYSNQTQLKNAAKQRAIYEGDRQDYIPNRWRQWWNILKY